MGRTYRVSGREADEAHAVVDSQIRAKAQKRMDLADKLVMVLVDRIVADLIRPGPKPEERECYEVAQELRDMASALRELVVQVLDTEGGVT